MAGGGVQIGIATWFWERRILLYIQIIRGNPTTSSAKRGRRGHFTAVGLGSGDGGVGGFMEVEPSGLNGKTF